jgi:hypothetical protein
MLGFLPGFLVFVVFWFWVVFAGCLAGKYGLRAATLFG